MAKFIKLHEVGKNHELLYVDIDKIESFKEDHIYKGSFINMLSGCVLNVAENPEKILELMN